MVVGGVAGVTVGLAAVYGIGTRGRNPDAAACGPAVERARALAPLARGEVAAVTVATKPLKLPPVAFKDADGKTHTLDEWRGRTVLLNLWATWCVPCREEMPALDALQQQLGGPAFEVVAVNIDTRDPAKPKAWLDEVGIEHLAYYADADAKVFQDLKAIGLAFGMPTTVLVDGNGCELGYLAGPAEWASEDAVTLVKAALEN
jgi:thiol-disulfide isomerase/thioredoxin